MVPINKPHLPKETAGLPPKTKNSRIHRLFRATAAGAILCPVTPGPE